MTPYSSLVTMLLGTFLLIMTINVHALPTTPTTSTVSEDTGPSHWPDIGHAPVKPRKDPTNGERIKRGLNPLPPRKRSPTATHQLVPRLSPVPALAGEGYDFIRCADSFQSAFNGGTLTASDVQSAVDQCAAISNSNGYDNFVIRYASSNTYLCQSGNTNVNNRPCDDVNYGFYAEPQ
ncbi:hypothetical protein IAR55_002645 [Kwoniella newhampshirensis]|uniref:Uncharacterized protein n=1 Tax=Kwoniella newhampshirensis TaxID=1651941 RepID=A0AAW0YPH8_9TREE